MADFDGNGHSDIVVSARAGGRVFASFATSPGVLQLWGWQELVIAHDLDKNGLMDVLVNMGLRSLLNGATPTV